MGGLSFRTRQENLERMAHEEFDILVIGGGITGAGIAWDAALRGFKTALVEKGDFASGTSSRSSRLIHGGLRYLKYFQFDLVYEACRERALLWRRLAPHLVHPLPFIYPIYRGEGVGKAEMRIGMWLYEALALSHNVGRHRFLGPQEVLELEPHLKRKGLQGGTLFYDCQADDARLTLVTVRAAHRAGAVVANYAEAAGLLKAKGRVRGAAVKDVLTGKEVEVKAKVVVNAAGPWGGKVAALDSPESATGLRLTKGIHLVIRRERIGHRYAITISSPRDGRFVFILPWGDFTIVGTTDTDYQGDLDRVCAEPEDVEYLLEAVNYALPEISLKEEDIISTYAALRPLAFGGAQSPYDVSRKHRIFKSPSGMLWIAGGKLTTFRKMAYDLVNATQKVLAREYGVYPSRGCTTHLTPLPGGANPPDESTIRALEERVGEKAARYLASSYGDELPRVLELVEGNPSLGEPLVEGLPYIKAQVILAVEEEMALTLQDLLIRRTRIIYEAPDGGLQAAGEIARMMGELLGWDEARCRQEVESYKIACQLTR
ncbi:MAG TPA: glycerol-3-phosphate dehydrogenase/oxidase [Chloroflexi bacterium]|nr:glycerol-3-phosphate dehydrogenase/oxidase [Chloroflexota bacterium]